MYSGMKILVTGGTGSFGHYIVKELIPKGPDEIRVFSRDEKKQDDMRYEFREHNNLRFIIGDVRDRSSLQLAAKGVDYIFHAAALKQVPSCEYNVFEAVQTNIIGAKNLVDVAIEEKIKKVIAISTDKAVKPVNCMGMTKAIQEKLMIWGNLNRNGSQTVFAAVRYGNVVGSRGSVIPLFKRQIDEGGPLTITDPEMTRFVLTLDQAVRLVFKAAEEAVGGEIFVMKIPSIIVGTLAQIMMKGISESSRPKVSIIGIRPGEKIHEVLISEEEAFRTIDLGDYYCILPPLEIDATKLKYQGMESANIPEYTSGNTSAYSDEALEKLLIEEGWMPAVKPKVKIRRSPEAKDAYNSDNRIGIMEEMVLL